MRSGRFALPRPPGHQALDLARLLFHHERVACFAHPQAGLAPANRVGESGAPGWTRTSTLAALETAASAIGPQAQGVVRGGIEQPTPCSSGKRSTGELPDQVIRTRDAVGKPELARVLGRTAEPITHDNGPDGD